MIKVFLDNMKRAAPKSYAFLLLIPSLVIVAFSISYIYFRQSLVQLPDCLIWQITGYPCPSCGITRSIRALINFKFVNSFILHPLPFLVCIFLFSVWVNAFINVTLRKRDKPFPVPLIWYFTILSIVILSWLNKIFEILPLRMI
ncbi:MAG: DUF2752 domain-containing protein [Oscillospiraceae bacterium]|nr:DUF2752 domain-containing protein [Oscillospiraceae bacterium]